jgi:hypothetical protein
MRAAGGTQALHTKHNNRTDPILMRGLIIQVLARSLLANSRQKMPGNMPGKAATIDR